LSFGESTLDSTRSLVRQSSGEQAARYIRHLIFAGRLSSGAHVPQDEIAGELGMSRIPIREALIALERQGWVRIERHRGAFVSPLDPASVRDHYELYGLIYGFAARRALERSGDALLGELRGIVEALPEVTDDPVRFGDAALSFHRGIVDGSRSPRIAVALRSMSNLVPGDFFVLVPGSIAVERKGLAAILRALERSDPDTASEQYLRMMDRIGTLVVALFAERGLFAEADEVQVG
jgi:DNA-binding GntR family transcriptional regulator